MILSPKGTVNKITCVQGLQRVKDVRGARSPFPQEPFLAGNQLGNCRRYGSFGGKRARAPPHTPNLLASLLPRVDARLGLGVARLRPDGTEAYATFYLSLIHISEPTRRP